MEDDIPWKLEPLKRFSPTVVGFTLGCLMFLPRFVGPRNNGGAHWLLLHSLCGPFEKAIYSESVGLTHTDIFFGTLLLFIMWSHAFSMGRATVILSIIGSFLWVAAAVGHYG
jgi:hypothetical protein